MVENKNKRLEEKLGFDRVRKAISDRCSTEYAATIVDNEEFSTNPSEIKKRLQLTDEMRLIVMFEESFPASGYIDCTVFLKMLELSGSNIDLMSLGKLRTMLDTLRKITAFFSGIKDGIYPNLKKKMSSVIIFPEVSRRIDTILDKFGNVKDTASDLLYEIRKELKEKEGAVSKRMAVILKKAQQEGIVDSDAGVSIRDGKMLIPVSSAKKRKLQGFIYDESASGKTTFIEPAEIVELQNEINELHFSENREIFRILYDFTEFLRPYLPELQLGAVSLCELDFIIAKAQTSLDYIAGLPLISDNGEMNLRKARHPLLEKALKKEHKEIVPLTVTLTPDKHILLISGPNAGGKSVCLKTVALLQYMLQCGLPIPVSERSSCGLFNDLMLDIGDEQSLENDLSTYSSHLLNMKHMMRQATDRTLILIDEFGTGTEPQIGGAIAESVLDKFCSKGAWGVITTHYQNLKHFADTHAEVANGAMLYDRHEMRALFQLAIGRPGSSFAIEIARKIGLPEDVIAEASEIVGSDYIQSDKYLQDIVRDKRYWEGKRQSIHQREKELEKTIARYEEEIQDLRQQRRTIVAKAKADAEELLRESNRRIENAIREIREQQAEKEATKRIREELRSFEQTVKEEQTIAHKAHGLMSDDDFEKKLAQIQQRKQRKEKRKQEKATQQIAVTPRLSTEKMAVGDTVRIQGLKSTGTIEAIDGDMCTVIFGDMRSKMRLNRLETAVPSSPNANPIETAYQVSRATRDTIDDHKKNFRQDLDVRGMRGDEALTAVQHFIDDAILVGISRVRILHGKGNGILRTLIRQYLSTVPNVVHYADEHVQFGGAGITIVDF